jgi:hypothetical protein
MFGNGWTNRRPNRAGDDMTGKRADADAVITSLAARQHGIVSRRQLLNAGIAPDQVAGRVRRRRLRRLQRGVYLVGPLMVPRARLMSAALCCGESAVVGHESAARLWELMVGHESAARVWELMASETDGPRSMWSSQRTIGASDRACASIAPICGLTKLPLSTRSR